MVILAFSVSSPPLHGNGNPTSLERGVLFISVVVAFGDSFGSENSYPFLTSSLRLSLSGIGDFVLKKMILHFISRALIQ